MNIVTSSGRTYLDFFFPLPKNCSIFLNFFRCFSCNSFINRINISCAIFLMQPNESIEITFAPICETYKKGVKNLLSRWYLIRHYWLMFFNSDFTKKFWLQKKCEIAKLGEYSIWYWLFVLNSNFMKLHNWGRSIQSGT